MANVVALSFSFGLRGRKDERSEEGSWEQWPRRQVWHLLVSFHKILNLLYLSFIGKGAISIFLGFVYLLDLLQSVPRCWVLAFLLGDWVVFDHVVFLTTLIAWFLGGLPSCRNYTMSNHDSIISTLA
jgi:hypothetical protein